MDYGKSILTICVSFIPLKILLTLHCPGRSLQVVNDEDDLEYRIFHVFRYIKPKKESRKKAIKSESRKKPRVSRQEASAWGHDTRCKTCGRDDDEAVLMQCSFCEQGYRHTYCVGLVEVPEGHWFCSGACLSNDMYVFMVVLILSYALS